jgi:hypothetical protein
MAGRDLRMKQILESLIGFVIGFHYMETTAKNNLAGYTGVKIEL